LNSGHILNAKSKWISYLIREELRERKKESTATLRTVSEPLEGGSSQGASWGQIRRSRSDMLVVEVC
jgi:hypothetical protein